MYEHKTIIWGLCHYIQSEHINRVFLAGYSIISYRFMYPK
jgi:hypothetical protein